MVQNFAHFQQFCRPGTECNRFVPGDDVPRCEAACVCCAQKDFLEHRHKVCLFGEPAKGDASVLSVQGECMESSEDEAVHKPQRSLQKQAGVSYLQSPELVNELLDVHRCARRWPLIPLDKAVDIPMQNKKQRQVPVSVNGTPLQSSMRW